MKCIPTKKLKFIEYTKMVRPSFFYNLLENDSTPSYCKLLDFNSCDIKIKEYVTAKKYVCPCKNGFVISYDMIQNDIPYLLIDCPNCSKKYFPVSFDDKKTNYLYEIEENCYPSFTNSFRHSVKKYINICEFILFNDKEYMELKYNHPNYVIGSYFNGYVDYDLKERYSKIIGTYQPPALKTGFRLPSDRKRPEDVAKTMRKKTKKTIMQEFEEMNIFKPNFGEACEMLAKRKGYYISDAYNFGGVGRSQYNKYKNDLSLRVPIDVVFGMAIGLTLKKDEADEFLNMFFYYPPRFDKRDSLVYLLITNGVLNITEINNILYECDKSFRLLPNNDVRID